jgi:hypothetical protein
MNERIKKLALEAGKYADETQPRGSYTRDGMWLYAYNEKFAELIIEETHRKVIASILITDVVMDANGQVPTSEDYIRAIKNDFGVEE